MFVCLIFLGLTAHHHRTSHRAPKIYLNAYIIQLIFDCLFLLVGVKAHQHSIGHIVSMMQLKVEIL